MSDASMRNVYLEQVVQEKAELEQALKGRARQSLAAPADFGGLETGRPAVDVRITGFWRFKNVIVPPNAYVVHTRRGLEDPIHIGLGISFRFDPTTDAFLVVPAAMQTIVIQANCICQERQGVLVQAYVQWIIDDFAIAYRKLDLSDPDEPMRVVNVQLREQAEAAIKDKVATMSIDEVLADKQPIIEELTARLRAVAEGQGDRDKGLGLRIVTVQIKEAVVCSPRVWEMLQRPFRAERAKEARLAELANEAVVQAKEAEEAKVTVRLEIEGKTEAERLETEAAAEAFDREQAERVRRAKVEAATLQETLAHEKAKLEQEAELERLRLEGELAVRERRAETDKKIEEGQVAVLAARRRVENDRSAESVKMAFVETLPDVAKELPKLSELHAITVGESGLSALTRSLTEWTERRATLAPSKEDER